MADFARNSLGQVQTKTVGGLRQCASCLVLKSLDGFSRTGRGGEYVASYCLMCYAARASAYYHANRSKVRAKDRGKYRVDAGYRDGQKQRAARWGKENQQRRRELVRASYYRNLARSRSVKRASEQRRRAWKVGLSGDVTPLQIEARVAFYGWRCWMCGDPYDCIDHVKPLAKGGFHLPANIRPACSHCNSQKGAKWPLEG